MSNWVQILNLIWQSKKLLLKVQNLKAGILMPNTQRSMKAITKCHRVCHYMQIGSYRNLMLSIIVLERL